MTTKRGATDWQIDRSVLQTNQYMLENAIAADVSFRVHSPGGATVEEIPAHSYMLIARSPVFEALFLGSFPDGDVAAPNSEVGEDQQSTGNGGKKVVDISDVEPEAFHQLLRYIYCEIVNLTPDNVLPVLYAAKKYMITPLARKCMDFLELKITTDSVCTILNHSILYDEPELTEKCLWYISPRTKSVFSSDSFLGLSSGALKRFLGNSLLFVNSEVDVLDACLRWAKHNTRSQNVDITDLEIRRLLGDNLYKIRFSSMSAQDFAKFLGKREILNSEEKSRFYYHLLTNNGREGIKELGFDMSHRVLKCTRYSCLGKTAGWWTCNGPGDAISFTVGEPIVFLGVCLYGGREPSTHKVVLELFENIEVSLKRTEQRFVSDGSTDPFPVYFDGPQVTLTPGETYTVVTQMKGPISYYGQGGADIIPSNGVTFRFLRSEKSGNGTNIKSGQIPELLFLLKNESP